MSGEYRESSSNKTVLIVVGIIAGVILVLILGCFGLGYLFVKAVSPAISSAMQMAVDMQMAPQVAQEFLEDIAADRLEVAYKRTSKNYQQGQSLEAFRKLIAKYPAFKNSTINATNMQQMTPGRCTLQYSASSPQGSVSSTVIVIKEGEDWKVDQFTVESDSGNLQAPRGKVK